MEKRKTGTRTANAARPTQNKNTRSAAAGSSAPRKKSAKKRRRKLKKPARLFRFALVILILMLVAVGVSRLISGGNEEMTLDTFAEEGEHFYEGISVCGVDVGGLTLVEAESRVRAHMNDWLGTVQFSLSHGEGTAVFNASDLGLSYNIDSALAEAAAYGRTGSRAENAEVRDQLLAAGKNFDAEITWNRSMILTKLETIAASVNTAPVEPHGVPRLNENNVQRFEFEEGKSGRTLQQQLTADAIENALKAGSYSGSANAVFEEVQPTLSMEFVKENTDRISTYSTSFRTSGSDEIIQNRVFNIEKASDLINCVVVAPGEEWSFNDWVGPRTKDTGWKEANGISGGKSYTLQAGGGICQVSTTLYNALLRGNIKITERRAHSIPSDYVPKGMDATVDSRGIDLKFVNDTGAPLYIFSYIKPSETSNRRLTVTVSLYGKPLPDGVAYEARSEITETIPRENTKFKDDASIPTGYQIESVPRRDGIVAKAYLDRYENGKLVESVHLHTDKYNGNDAEVRVGTGDPLTVPVPEGAVAVGTAVKPQDGEPEL
ncbi:MAG: VanW family protein [Clostridia bacterium]|nr:VanW family protein [Clostridia bacterium]